MLKVILALVDYRRKFGKFLSLDVSHENKKCEIQSLECFLQNKNLHVCTYNDIRRKFLYLLNYLNLSILLKLCINIYFIKL